MNLTKRRYLSSTFLCLYSALIASTSLTAIAGSSSRLTEALNEVSPPPVVEEPTPEPAVVKLPPGQMATLETIAKAEGTWDQQSQSIIYNMRFADAPGRGSLDITRPHPQTVKGSRYGSGYRSDASGAFQFLSTTWIGINGGFNLPMTPENQKLAASVLVRKTGYNFDRPFRTQAHLLAGTWASIPTRGGYSYYGQPVKSLHELSRFYEWRVAFHSVFAKVALVEEEDPKFCYLGEHKISSGIA